LGPATDEADVLLLGGDLTDHGSPEEAETLAEDLATLRLPKVAVLGNHDYESDRQAEIIRILAHAGVTVLQGDTWIFDKRLGIAGVKGFGGGFDTATLQAWGEAPTKAFVQEAVNEALKLEMALTRLDVLNLTAKIAVTHYAPVHSTVVGEKSEIFPFLGCSRFSEVLDRCGVLACFHGHAHHGTLRGETAKGIPVYNTAMPLLKAELDRRFVVIEFDAPSTGDRAWHEPRDPKAQPMPPTKTPSPVEPLGRS
jgi:Icc-related predicted phosphoesterase